MKTQVRRGRGPKVTAKVASRAKVTAVKSSPAVKVKPRRAAPPSKPAKRKPSPPVVVKAAPPKPPAPVKPVKRFIPPPQPPARPLAPPPPPGPDKQQQYYDEAVKLFHAQKYDRADALFQKAMLGSNRALAHHAQVHSQVCQKRLKPTEVKLRSADDHYNYAVTLINTRRLKEAAEHLEVALRMEPQADHLHYAMAAVQALQGNQQAAYERLKAAIDIQPRNRILARGDADFAGILEYPPVASLLRTN